MSILNNFDIDQNFWESNPQFKIPKEFKKFYDEDKSVGKAQSSKILWAIALLLDNSDDNKFRNLPYKDRQDLISEDYLENSKFSWEKYQTLIDGYYDLHMSKLERSLNIYEHKLEERDEFIRTAKYNLESASSLDKIISSTKGIYDLITKLRDEINREKEASTTKADMVESASEKGEL